MTLIELIRKALDDLEEHGDPQMEVKVYADHGQDNSSVYTADVEYLDDDGESVHPVNINPKGEYTKAFVISGE